MHVLRLSLATTEYDEQVLADRYFMISHIHNVVVKHAKKLLRQLDYNREYQASKDEYTALLKEKKAAESSHSRFPKEKSNRMKELSGVMYSIRQEIGFCKAGLESYIKICGRKYKKHISSQQVQKEADRVWDGVEKVLFGNGEELHFKKYRDFDTICGKSATNGIKFDKESFSIEWNGLHIRCRLPRKHKDVEAGMPYIMESIDHKVSYCEIKRRMFPNGWHYYLNVYLEGDAPRKLKTVGDADNRTGLDLGTSTAATVSDNMATLEELAPKCYEFNRKIRNVSRHMDRSKRASNPNKYKPDGTIDRTNKDKWVLSKTYLKSRDKLKSLYRQKSEYINQSHRQYINRLITDSINFITENMNFSALQKRSKKKAERSDRVSVVAKKDGTEQSIRKFKRKKRYGSSMNNRSPSRFLVLLEQKVKLYGGALYKVDTWNFRASQYDHTTDTNTKINISDRFKSIDGHEVQRDLYSGFLLKNSNGNLNHPNREKCIYEFDSFIKLHDELISNMKADGKSMKACFGF